jgi:hypothetical protein
LPAPVFAAAMLMLVVSAGIFSYYKLFEQSFTSINPSVVLSVPQSQSASDSVGKMESAPLTVTGQEQSTPRAETTTEAPYKADGTTIIMQDADTLNAGSVDRQNVPPGLGGGDPFMTKQNSATGTSTEEQSIAMTSSQSSGASKFSIASRSVLRQGTLQEAAREVGFTPALPGYLPSGAELKDVTWESGAIYLGYRADRNSFKLTQSRNAGGSVIGEEGGRLIDLNGAKAYLQETGSEGDSSIYFTVRWQRGEWEFKIEGDLPGEEILRIALSME